MELSFLAPLFAVSGTIPLFNGYALTRWVIAGSSFLLVQWAFDSIDLLRLTPVQELFQLTQEVPLIGDFTETQWLELLGLILGLILSLLIYRMKRIVNFLVGFSILPLLNISFTPIESIDVFDWGLLLLFSAVIGLFVQRYYKFLAITGTSLYGSYIIANSIVLGDILLGSDGIFETSIQFGEDLFGFSSPVLIYQMALFVVGFIVQYLVTAKD